MFIDTTKLDRKQVKEIVLAAGWWWDESKSIDGETDRRDVENLVNEAYTRGFKTGLNARTTIAEIVNAWEENKL
jgi:hypothetical protein